MLDFAGKRWWYLSVSIVLFLASAGALGLWGLKAGIEFTSGSSFTLEFTEQTVTQSDLRQAMRDLGHPEARIQGAGTNTYIIRTSELENAPNLDSAAGPAPPGEIDEIESALRTRFGEFTREDFSTVSGTVSSEIARYATFAVFAAAVAILLYVWVMFRQLPKPWRYGTCAIVALVHDAFIILGLFAVLGEFRNTEVDTAFITAILTVIGFSVHDTIVVFDRIRENAAAGRIRSFPDVVNHSLLQTMGRSFNTSLTLVFSILALLLLGGESIRDFLLVLLIGVITGTYSSVFIASMFLVTWQQGDIPRAWRRITGRSRAAGAVEAPAK